ncbi:MAG TPA: glycosyltransferase family 4 protein [Balneolales bacterium]|nr:glycosyltransferase family 4 protein [Balneolales bacterium]
MYVSHTLPPDNAILKNIGGMQRVSLQLLNELKRREDIELIEVTLKAPWKWVGPLTAWFMIKQLFKIPDIVRRKKPDVILFSSMVTASMAYFLRKRVDVPMITINHGQDVTLPIGIYQKFIPKIFKSLDGVISVSSATREQCIIRGMSENQGVALPNGFPADEHKNLSDSEKSKNYIQEKFQINLKNKYLLLTVGRLVRRKGHYWFIEKVLPKIKTDVVYVVIGDGPELNNVRKLISHSPVKENIILLGRQPDEILHHAYSAADLFIMPNIKVYGDMEGFGIVLLEANNSGTPAIASKLEGIQDVVKKGVNGFLIEPGNHKKFADKVDKVLQNGLQDLSRKSQTYVKNNFNWENVVNQYLDYIQLVVDGYRRSN